MTTVLITGAGKGIGLEFVKQYLALGFEVIGTYRSKNRAEELFELKKSNSKLHLVSLDLSSESGFEELIKFSGSMPKLNFLINNSGVIGSREAPFDSLTREQMLEVFSVNTLGPMRVMQILKKCFVPGAVVAQISSIMGSISQSEGGYYQYRVSKCGLNMLNHCLAADFPEYVFLSLHPGWVKTEMGGAGATLSVQDSVRGLINVISQAKGDAKASGRFFDYRGEEISF